MTMPRIKPDTPGYLPEDERPKCENCGVILRAHTRFDTKTEKRPDAEGRVINYAIPGFHNFRITGWGYRGDNLFCTAGCGYAYACRCVRGRRS